MAELQKGISILYDLELNNYLMTSAVEQIKKKDAQLCKKKSVEKERKRTKVPTF